MKLLQLNVATIFIILNLITVYGEAQTLPENDQVVRRGFFERGKINGNISYITGRLSDYEKGSDGSLNFERPIKRLKNTIALNLGINLFERVYFRTSLYYNFNRNINAPWLIPDYAYVVERAKWDPNTFSYGYVNYEFNRYSDNLQQIKNNALKGSFYVRYYNTLPDSWIDFMKVDSTATVSYSITMKYAVRYQSEKSMNDGDVLRGKPVVNLSVRYAFLKYLYVESALLFYLRPQTQMPFDPDFTYGFGYNSYTHLSLAFSYGNYAVNRFPWHKSNTDENGFLDGQFSILLNYSW